MSPEQFKHYLVGNPKFDSEHYMMFERINIFRALENPSVEEGEQALQDVLIGFIEHVAAEESYMEATDFKFLEYHKTLHSSLSKQLGRYIKTHAMFGKLIKNELYDFSLSLAHHIDEADRQFYDLHKI